MTATFVGTDAANGFPNVTNDLNVTLNNSTGAYGGAVVYQFVNGHGYGNQEVGNPGSFGGGWAGGGGDITLNPGQAVFFYNPNPVSGGSAGNMTATFVGTVPQGTLTNTLVAGYNLVGSIVPTSGDLVTNSITAFSVANSGDYIYFFNSAASGSHQVGFENQDSYTFGSWGGTTGPLDPNIAANGDPQSTAVSQGFFYYNANTTEQWVETFSVNP
jgi:hypothetical protein